MPKRPWLTCPPYYTLRIVIVPVLVAGTMLLTGVSGSHGPGRHLPSGGAGGRTPPIAQVVQQP